MAENKTYLVDLSKVDTERKLHNALQKGLSLPDYYGKNLDALHDCLTDIMEPTVITFVGYKPAKKALEAAFYAFRKAVEDSAEENENLTIQWRRRK